MATTKIHPIKSTLKKSLDYIMNETKTDGKILVAGIGCSSEAAYLDFQITKNYFDKVDKILAHHITQSFKPGEVTYEVAHEIGLQLAKRVLKENYQAVLATHIDKGHIHNHIIFNSVSHIDGQKYKSNKKNYEELRKQSDELCEKYSLSVIEKPKEKGIQYKEWDELKKGTSWKEIIRNDIDEIINQSKSFEEFLQKMRQKDYSIRQGKFISFKPRTKERYVRGKTLGIDYTEENIRRKIELKELGFEISTYTSTKSYSSKKNYSKKIKLFKRKRGLLEINLMLAMMIVKELANKKEKRPQKTFVKNSKDNSYKKVKYLASQLEFVKSENITDLKKFENLKSSLQHEMKNNKEKMKEADKIASKNDELFRYLVSYKANKEIYEKVKSSNIFSKKRMENKYEVEVKTFEYVKEKLNAAGVKTDEDIRKFEIQYQEFVEKRKVLNDRYETFKQKNLKYESLDEAIKKLKDKEYIFDKKVEKEERKWQEEQEKN